MKEQLENLFALNLGGINWPVLVIAFILIPIIVKYTWISTALLSDQHYRKILLIIRFIAISLVLLFLLQPMVVIKKAENKKTAIAVLLDASPSMIKEGSQLSRAMEFINLHKKNFEALSSKYDLSFMSFSADTLIDSVGGHSLKSLTRFRDATSLSDALNLIRETKPGGIILLSDGRFGDRLSLRERSGLPLFDKDDEFGACLFYPIRLSETTGKYNIAVTSANADEFAYVKNPFTIKVRLHAESPTALKVPIKVTCNGESVLGSEIAIKKGSNDYEATLEITPEKVGYFIYTVSVPPYSFESSEADNKREFSLKVIRDRIRIMQVAGRPTWDVRFLRETLKKDPAIDLVAFYIMRTASDVMDVPQDELSLIEFPYRELFDKDLSSFDLVIFQNFSYRMFFGPEYVDNIRKFVEAGGAFWMIGGDISFSEGGYRNTAAETMLPFTMVDPERNAAAPEYSVLLTEDGLSHPITSECRDLDGFKFEGLNILGSMLPNSLTLIKTKDNHPLLGVREFQKGRTAALATDAFWYYDFVGVGSGHGNRSYQEFVRRMVRWLVKDPAVGSIGFSGIKGEYPEGQSVSFNVQYNGNPLGKTLSVSLVNGKGKVSDSKRIVLNKETMYPVEFNNPGRGIYIVRTEVLKNKVIQDYSAESFEVSSSNEYGDVKAGQALLEKLATESNGRMIEFKESDFEKRMDVPEKTIKRIVNRKTYPLWNNYAAIIIACLVFGLEWFLRKRKGLL